MAYLRECRGSDARFVVRYKQLIENGDHQEGFFLVPKAAARQLSNRTKRPGIATEESHANQ